jgi:hypothetical protein
MGQPGSRSIPGLSVLGGAAAGFSIEGLLRDALARIEAERRAAPPPPALAASAQKPPAAPVSPQPPR